MKRPTPASLKKVTPDNLERLGVDRLAAILAEVADSRPELKRRLRMELAAEQGAEPLGLEIDKRLATLETSRSKVSWRKRPSFIVDLDVIRALIAERLAALDRAAALARMWIFMDLARRLGTRVRDRDGSMEAVFAQAAVDIAALIAERPDDRTAAALVEAFTRNPSGWSDWVGPVLAAAPAAFADATLAEMRAREITTPGWISLLRQVSDASGDVGAFQSTFSAAALKTPSVAAQVATRLLQAGQVEAAGRALEAAQHAKKAAPDFEWETASIAYLEAAGQGEAAQTARWASFERTLSADRARAFTRRLADFEDVEAEDRAFDHAAQHADFERGLQFLMDWPALPAAARMIQARRDEAEVAPEAAELWAARLRVRQPAAAHILLRKAAAAAFRRRDFATCDRLTQEADAIEPT